MYNPNLFHGAFLLDSNTKIGLVGEIRALLAESGDIVISLARPVLKRTLTLVGSALAPLQER